MKNAAWLSLRFLFVMFFPKMLFTTSPQRTIVLSRDMDALPEQQLES